MNGSFRLAHYETHHLPLSKALRPREFYSSSTSSDLRNAAEELRALYVSGNQLDQFAMITFLREATDQETPNRYDELIELERRPITETAVVSSQDALSYLDNPPEGTQWATLHSWHSALLVCLGFVWEPSV